ncbi:MAG: hypothetical protein JOZ83_14370 [Silvibacterium sp.]|nr:hypothetical protein [Silvibacterium sp.]
MKTEELITSHAQPGEAQTLNQPTDASTEPGLRLDRRRMLTRAGMVLGATGALAALTIPSSAAGRESAEEADEMNGLWQGTISSPDNSFSPFGAFLMYGGGIWTGSGSVDLTLAALSSTLWGAFKRIGPHQFHGIGRFWTYDANFNPTGFATVDQINTVSRDGKKYHGDGALQYFDNNGNSVGPATAFSDDSTRVPFS